MWAISESYLQMLVFYIRRDYLFDKMKEKYDWGTSDLAIAMRKQLYAKSNCSIKPLKYASLRCCPIEIFRRVIWPFKIWLRVYNILMISFGSFRDLFLYRIPSPLSVIPPTGFCWQTLLHARLWNVINKKYHKALQSFASETLSKLAMFSSWDIPKWKLSHCASGFLFNQFFVVLEIITALTPEFLNHIFLNNPSSYHQIVTSTYPNGNFSKHTSLLYTATISIFFFFSTTISIFIVIFYHICW